MAPHNVHRSNVINPMSRNHTKKCHVAADADGAIR